MRSARIMAIALMVLAMSCIRPMYSVQWKSKHNPAYRGHGSWFKDITPVVSGVEYGKMYDTSCIYWIGVKGLRY